mmetsp:Transcript_27415/g.64035  ORF Transcript_27415/g.64035 Transcript_27415/m.64035 type:complete len:1045 (-) Transcript_27415:184-3318(-)
MAVAFRLRSRPAISEWSVDQVCDFLETIGLDADTRDKFRAEAVDGRALYQITDEDLSSVPFKLPFGTRKSLLNEVRAQQRYAKARGRQQAVGSGPKLVKGSQPEGPKLSADALDRIRKWRLDPASGRLAPREPLLTDEELECWEYQASWLVCPITGKAWARSDVVSTMGVALYHAPRFCSEKERQRLFVEEEQARKYDAERKAAMDHSGTSFEREYEVYPVVEPPPLANLPLDEAADSASQQQGSEDADQEQLQRLRMEVSGLKGRSAAVQRQMFEGLAGEQDAGGQKFIDSQDVGRALEQLKVEPREDVELAKKFGIYESYFAGVVELRTDLFALWERGQPLLQPRDAATMRTALGRVDSFENLSIPDRSRHWFVYHMMSVASTNHRKMQQVLEDLEELFEAALDRQAAEAGGSPVEDLSDDPQLGVMEVVIGPAFDMDAYNDGVKGNTTNAVLAAADRGILDMDRQYNAVNFQYFAQQADAGVTRAGAEASYKRRLCTSRLSFYIEESHGSRIFPRNILSQLSLLFYRRNDALRLSNGKVHEARVAVCIRKAIPRMLKSIVVDVFQGDRSFAPHMEKAVRVYLALHQVAIKLLATFRKSYELLYQSVLEWIQQPFSPKSEAAWPDLEELLLGASLCAVPWSLLREAFVRKLFVQLLESTTKTSAKAHMRQKAEHLFTQNRVLLERLTYILTFFQAGPGKLPVQEMDKKYCRCAGSLPKSEREALVEAAKEGSGIASLVDLWTVLGMQRAKDTDEPAILRHIEVFLEYVQANVASWRAAPPAPSGSSEGPVLPPAALEQLAMIDAQTSGSAAAHSSAAPRAKPMSRNERALANAQRLAAERAQHKGFPNLPPSRRLDGTLCYYCQRRFPSRQALFAHLRRMIEPERFIEGMHQSHFGLVIPGGPAALPPAGTHRCKAESCKKNFASKTELWQHYHEMGVPGFEQRPPEENATQSKAEPSKADHLQEESGPPAAANDEGEKVLTSGADLSQCAVCLDRPADVVMVPCGHIFACQSCGKKLKECAVCRANVAQVMRVYYSADAAA